MVRSVTNHQENVRGLHIVSRVVTLCATISNKYAAVNNGYTVQLPNIVDSLCYIGPNSRI